MRYRRPPTGAVVIWTACEVTAMCAAGDRLQVMTVSVLRDSGCYRPCFGVVLVAHAQIEVCLFVCFYFWYDEILQIRARGLRHS
jgi:hypothetical protein